MSRSAPTSKLYIVHGWSYSVESWHEVATYLKNYHITAEILNVPGLTAPSKKAWTIEDYVSWANRNIPDGAIALGHSNGGRILMNMLVKYPQKLKGLILLDAAGIYARPTLKNRLFYIGAKLLAPLKPIKPLRKLVHKFIGASDYARAPENMKKTLNNMLASDKTLDPSQITTPTRIIWGAKDQITPLRDAQKIHAMIKGSKLIVKPDWTHAPYLKVPAEVAKVIAKSTQELNS